MNCNIFVYLRKYIFHIFFPWKLTCLRKLISTFNDIYIIYYDLQIHHELKLHQFNFPMILLFLFLKTNDMQEDSLLKENKVYINRK